MIFLSLGAGVQSSVMLMMAIKGEIERPEHVIFADTGFEPQKVYRHATWCEKQCVKAGIPFHVVADKQTMRQQFDAFEKGEIPKFNNRPPFFVINTAIPGSGGTLHRQCTRDAKIRPIERKQLELMGYKTARGVPDGAAVVQIGISTDEVRRASASEKGWTDRSYPLIDPLKFSRSDCQAWWDRNYPHISLPSSSCVICPYKTKKMWGKMKLDAPEDWAVAVDYDERIRKKYADSTTLVVYLYSKFQPLAEIDFNEGQGEIDFDEAIYCSGGCGL